MTASFSQASCMSRPILRAPFIVRNAFGEEIPGDLRWIDDGRAKPVVVICHSFMAFKDWGWFPFVAKKIAESGFASVIFNFSRNGVRDSESRITEFEAFQKNTISHELNDLRTVLNALKACEVGKDIVDSNKIVLLGHSRGGAVSIVTAAGSSDIAAVVTWSSVARFDRWTEHQKQQWRAQGYLPMARDSAASPLKLGVDLLEDVENNKEKLDITKAADRVTVPWLIVHGTEDLIVKIYEGEELFSASNKTTTKFVRLERVGHLYDGPDLTENSAIHRVLDVTIRWLHSHIRSLQE